MSICKCKVAEVNAQVEINFAKAPTTSYNFKRSVSIFSEGCRAAWIDVHEAQPSRTKCRSSKTEMKLQCGCGPGRPFPTKCLSILGNCRKSKRRFCWPLCVSIVKAAVKLRLFCVRMVLPDAFRSLEKGSGEIDNFVCVRKNLSHTMQSRSSRAAVKFWFCTCLLNSFALNWCPPSGIM